MNASKKKKLEAAGWKVGSASDFLELSPAEEMLVSMKLAMAAKVKALRERQRMTQTALAKRIGSSQARIAKVERADSSVSLELLVRSLSALGVSRAQVGKIVGSQRLTAKA